MSQKSQKEKRRKKKEEDQKVRDLAVETIKKINNSVEYAEGIIIELLHGQMKIKNPIHRAAIEKVVNHYRNLASEKDKNEN